jgi:hypothetical protein
VHGIGAAALSLSRMHTLRRHGSQKARATGPRGYAKHPNVSAHTRAPAKEYLCCVRLCTALPHLPGDTATSTREHCCVRALHCTAFCLSCTTLQNSFLHVFLSFISDAAVLRL